MTDVKLSQQTIDILTTASHINNAIIIRKGNIIRSATEGFVISMVAKVEEEFPMDVSIYELNRFLQVLTAAPMAGAVLKFNEANQYIDIVADKSTVRYALSRSSTIPEMTKEINVDPATINISFDLSDKTLVDIKKMASTLKHTHLNMSVKDNVIKLMTYNPKIKDASSPYTIEVNTPDGMTFTDYVCDVKLENVKLVPGNYNVCVFKNLALQFSNVDKEIKTYIGIEKTISD